MDSESGNKTFFFFFLRKTRNKDFTSGGAA